MANATINYKDKSGDDVTPIVITSVALADMATDSVNSAKIVDDSIVSDDMNETVLKMAEVTVSAADIIATEAGKFGHAAGVPVVADPGSGKYVEFVSGMLLYTRDTAAYTNGGNITFNANGGSAVTGLISAGNSLGAAASVVAHFPPLSTAAVAVTANKGINIVAAAAFTDPGTAAGTFKARVYYRVHSL